ncbi:MAG: ORF6N domain-containing protein [Steroidobacteraceae bacterium]
MASAVVDSDLAALYGLTTKRLNEQGCATPSVFQRTSCSGFRAPRPEALNRSRIVTGPQKHREPRFPTYAFTEHGAIMAATILNCSQVIEMSVFVVRAFVQLRELLASNEELARRLDALEARIEKKLTTHDQAIAAILSAIRQLMNPPASKRRPIGFTADLNEKT